MGWTFTVVTEERRRRVAAVLTPPTVSLIKMEKIGHSGIVPHNNGFKKSCSLCHYELQDKRPGHPSWVGEIVRRMMAEGGLDLPEDTTFCPFCSSQLQNLVSLKLRMDKMGEVFVTMVLGLQALFSMGSPQDPGSRVSLKEEEEEEDVDVKTESSEEIFLDEDSQTPITDHGSEGGDLNPVSLPENRSTIGTCTSGEIDIMTETNGGTSLVTLPKFAHNNKEDGRSEQRSDDEVDIYVHHPKINESSSNKILGKPTYKSNFPDSEILKALTHPDPREPSKMTYTCQLCGKVFKWKQAFTTHMRGVHWKEQVCQCGVCGKEYQSKMGLRYHSRTCPIRIVFNKCYFCSKSVKSYQEYHVHLQTHTTERPTLVCPTCGQHFATRRGLAKHISEGSQNCEERLHAKFLCRTCGKTFRSGNNLNRHRSTHGNGEKLHVCTICSNRFGTRRNLTRHMRRIHSSSSNIARFLCPTCGKGYRHRSSYKTHLLIHTGEKPHVCHICSRGFSQKSGLREHLNTHLPERERPFFQCQLCPRRYTNNRKFRRHKNNVHGTGSVKKLVCPTCNKTFLTNWNLKQHTLIHNGGKKKHFVCPDCNKAFPRQCSLHIHRRIHTRQIPQVCHTGSRPFSQKQDREVVGKINGSRKGSCYFCMKVHLSPGKLMEHMRRHTLERRTPFPAGVGIVTNTHENDM